MSTITMKICKVCNVLKPKSRDRSLSDFYDGRAVCKICHLKSLRSKNSIKNPNVDISSDNIDVVSTISSSPIVKYANTVPNSETILNGYDVSKKQMEFFNAQISQAEYSLRKNISEDILGSERMLSKVVDDKTNELMDVITELDTRCSALENMVNKLVNIVNNLTNGT